MHLCIYIYVCYLCIYICMYICMHVYDDFLWARMGSSPNIGVHQLRLILEEVHSVTVTNTALSRTMLRLRNDHEAPVEAAAPPERQHSMEELDAYVPYLMDRYATSPGMPYQHVRSLLQTRGVAVTNRTARILLRAMKRLAAGEDVVWTRHQ